MAMTDVNTFRREARAWLSENMERRDPLEDRLNRTVEEWTPEYLAEQRALQRRLNEGGYAGISWPEKYGGRGLTPAHDQAFVEEARDFVMPDFGIAGGTTHMVCMPTIIQHASDEFLSRHVPRVLAGEELICQFFSEPEAGSDLAGVRTRAERDGDRWILNGGKIWSSGAYYSDYGMCLARTNWDVPKHRGLTWFLVPVNAPGVTVQRIHQINGNSEFCQEFFDDVELTDDDVIGEVDQGWRVTQTMLVYERGGGRPTVLKPTSDSKLPADMVELIRRVDRTEDPVARQLIAQAAISDFAQACLGARTAAKFKESAPDAAVAGYVKLAHGIYDPIRGRIGMEIGGAAALTWAGDDPDGISPSIGYLNGRILSIAGGTNEMQRNAIGERVLGLPREPSFDTNKPFNEVIRNARNWSGQVG